MDGLMVLSCPSGEHYEGEFKSNAMDGRGVMVLPGGEVYTGTFEDGIMHGNGKFRFVDSGLRVKNGPF